MGHWCVKQIQLSCQIPKLWAESEILEGTIISTGESGSKGIIKKKKKNIYLATLGLGNSAQACGILDSQGSNPRPLHCKADS